MKLTSREKEILEALHKEPLISQEELAAHFGISRSSVAVHISNLMKKGIILGKGYVFNKKVSIVVVGQVCLEIDVLDDADQTLIDLQYAGFAREVCCALADFGIGSKLITVVGNDDLGSSILNELKSLDVDIANIYRHPDKRTSKKIFSNKGLTLIEGYTKEEYHQAIEAREWVAANCDWLVVEPEFQEYVGLKISGRGDKNPCLCTCHCVNGTVPAYLNRYQLLVLGVKDFRNYDQYTKMGQDFVENGTLNCVITDGNSNMLLVNNKGINDYPLPPNQSFDPEKGLHLYLAGLVYGLSAGYPMRQAMRIASGAAHAGCMDGQG